MITHSSGIIKGIHQICEKNFIISHDYVYFIMSTYESVCPPYACEEARISRYISAYLVLFFSFSHNILPFCAKIMFTAVMITVRNMPIPGVITVFSFGGASVR